MPHLTQSPRGPTQWGVVLAAWNALMSEECTTHMDAALHRTGGMPRAKREGTDCTPTSRWQRHSGFYDEAEAAGEDTGADVNP